MELMGKCPLYRARPTRTLNGWTRWQWYLGDCEVFSITEEIPGERYVYTEDGYSGQTVYETLEAAEHFGMDSREAERVTK